MTNMMVRWENIWTQSCSQLCSLVMKNPPRGRLQTKQNAEGSSASPRLSCCMWFPGGEWAGQGGVGGRFLLLLLLHLPPQWGVLIYSTIPWDDPPLEGNVRVCEQLGILITPLSPQQAPAVWGISFRYGTVFLQNPGIPVFFGTV